MNTDERDFKVVAQAIAFAALNAKRNPKNRCAHAHPFFALFDEVYTADIPQEISPPIEPVVKQFVKFLEK